VTVGDANILSTSFLSQYQMAVKFSQKINNEL
jgi:hypothetical protein